MFSVPDQATAGVHSVVSQCAGSGERAVEETFEVTASSGPVVVPSVIGMSLAEATETILAAGLEVGATNGDGSEVQEQEPDAGVEVDRGSPINLDFDSGISLWWVVVAVLLLLGLAGAASVAAHRRVERRWVRAHVDLTAATGRPGVIVSAEEGQPVPRPRHVVQLLPRPDRGGEVVVEELTDDP